MANEIRYTAVVEETSFNGEVTPSPRYYLDAPSVSLNAEGGREIVDPGAMSRVARRKVAGSYGVSGSIEYPFNVVVSGFFLKLLLGGYDYTENIDGFNMHEIYGTERKKMDSFVTFVGKDIREIVYKGLMVNEFSMSVSDELLMMNVNVVGAVDSDSGEVKDYETIEVNESMPIAYHQVKLFIDDVELESREFGMSVNNNIGVDGAKRLGSRFIGRAKGQERQTTVEIQTVNDDIEMLKKFWGSETGPGEAGADYFELRVEIDGGVEGMMDITFNKCFIDQTENNISGRDEMNPSVSLKCLNGGAVTSTGVKSSEILVELYNNEESY